MSQNQKSGAAANLWGRATACLIAEKLNTKILSKNSNECIYQNNRVVIKCAKSDTNSVGVTYKMLERLEFIIGAFQSDNGSFNLYKLPVSTFDSKMRATASKGSAKGKVGIARRSLFENEGFHMGTFNL